MHTAIFNRKSHIEVSGYVQFMSLFICFILSGLKVYEAINILESDHGDHVRPYGDRNTKFVIGGSIRNWESGEIYE